MDYEVTQLHGRLCPPYPKHEIFYVARKTPHRDRTTPTSYIKWWSFAVRTSCEQMVASLCSFKILFSSVWKGKQQTTWTQLCRLVTSTNLNYGRSYLFTLDDTFIIDFSSRKSAFVISEQGMKKLPFAKVFFRCLYYVQRWLHLSILRYWLFSWICRKCLSIWTLPGTRIVVLRMITPVRSVIPRYDDYVFYSKEGKLRWSRKASLENF